MADLGVLKFHLDREADRYQKAVEGIAGRVLRGIIVPFCDKHRVVFSCGMGTYCFHPIGTSAESSECIDSFDWEQHMKGVMSDEYRPPEGYHIVHAALHLDVLNGELFEFMGDYDPEEHAKDCELAIYMGECPNCKQDLTPTGPTSPHPDSNGLCLACGRVCKFCSVCAKVINRNKDMCPGCGGKEFF